MPLTDLRHSVLEANLALPAHGLVTLTWGNVSGIDRDRGLVAIKPSGVPYQGMTDADLVVLDLDGNQVEGAGRPSTDTPTHLALYRAFDGIGGIVHTHSTWATAWAQAEREIPILGTTHADLCADPIPLTRALTAEEVATDYEGATGQVIIEALGDRGPAEIPAPWCAATARSAGPPTPPPPWRLRSRSRRSPTWLSSPSLSSPAQVRCQRRCAKSTSSASTGYAPTTDSPAERATSGREHAVG